MKQDIIRINLGSVNSYLIKTEEGFVLVDTGGHLMMDKEFDGKQKELQNQLEKAGCKPGNLKLVILTHGDCDHSGNAAFIREKFKANIAMHEADNYLVENLTLEKLMSSFQYDKITLKIMAVLLKRLMKKVSMKTLKDFVSFKPDIQLNDGDQLLQYGMAAKVVHLPGHTPGSIGILLDSGEIILGDTFTNLKKPEIALNAMDFKQLRNSVSRLKQMNISTIYPGHGEPFRMKDLKLADR